MTRKKKAKRGNRKFTDPNGDIWDSQFEWLVYTGLSDQGYVVRRCDKRDTIAYHTSVQKGRCMECNGVDVVQERQYTPDLWVVEPDFSDKGVARHGFYIECKGYFPQSRRSMLRCVKECHQGIDLRFLFASEVKLTRARTNIEYVNRIIKCPATSWNKGAMADWRYP